MQRFLRPWNPNAGRGARGFVAGLCLLLAGPFAAADESPRPAGVAIAVAPGAWGTAEPAAIRQLLEAVAADFPAGAADRPARRLNIRVVPRGQSPRVLYERGAAGEYVVHLTARDEHWFQYAYQFAHELCHIVSNFDHKDMRAGETVADNQWFEESLCETASLATLKRLARHWAAAPDGQWAGQAPVFSAYAAYLAAEPHRRLPPPRTFAAWYRENEAALRENPYLREKNEVAAAALLALFERSPTDWPAIAYLNPHKASAAKGFADYLADWHAACPPAHREIVRQTMALFGFDPADVLAANPAPARLSLLSGFPADFPADSLP